MAEPVRNPDELKLCPFCGGRALEPYYYDRYDGYQGPGLGQYIIGCVKCSARVKERTKDKAIEVWNRRAEV